MFHVFTFQFQRTGCTDPKDVDPKTVMPIFDRLFCCLPKQTLDIIRCKIQQPSPQEIDVSTFLITQLKIKKKQIIILHSHVLFKQMHSDGIRRLFAQVFTFNITSSVPKLYYCFHLGTVTFHLGTVTYKTFPSI